MRGTSSRLCRLVAFGILCSAPSLGLSQDSIQKIRWRFKGETGSVQPFLLLAPESDRTLEALHITPEALRREAFGDVLFLNVPDQEFRILAQQVGSRADGASWIGVSSQNELVPLHREDCGDFGSLWARISPWSPPDTEQDLETFISRHPGNSDAEFELAVRRLKRIEFQLQAGGKLDSGFSQDLDEAAQSLRRLSDTQAWFSHPSFPGFEAALGILVRLGKEKREAIRPLEDSFRILKVSLQSELLRRPDSMSLWRAYGMLGALSDFNDLPRLLDNLEPLPGTPPPAGPVALHFGLSHRQEWALLRQVGKALTQSLLSNPQGTDAQRASAMLRSGSYALEADLREGLWQAAEADLTTIRAYSGSAWPTAAHEWRTFIANLTNGTIPAPLSAQLENPIGGPAIPPCSIQSPPVQVRTKDAATRDLLIGNSAELKLLNNGELQWAFEPRLASGSWQLARNNQVIASGSYGQQRSGALWNYVNANTSTRAQVLEQYLERHPGNRPADLELLTILHRAMPDRDLEVRYLELCDALEAPPAPLDAPVHSRTDVYIKKFISSLESRLMEAPMDSKAWMAWYGWNQCLERPSPILPLIASATCWGPPERFIQNLPLKVWGAAAHEMNSTRQWDLLASWCQHRLFPSHPPESKEDSDDLQVVSNFLTLARNAGTRTELPRR